MLLKSFRDLEKQKDVLYDPTSEGSDPVYWVFSEVSIDSWMNMTVIPSGRYGSECPKTYGHYHAVESPDESYKVVDGEGVLQMQKKHIEGSDLVSERVDVVYLITVRPGDEVIIKNHMGHSWSNVGTVPLITYDNWRTGHSPDEYLPI